jgi:regulatory protein
MTSESTSPTHSTPMNWRDIAVIDRSRKAETELSIDQIETQQRQQDKKEAVRLKGWRGAQREQEPVLVDEEEGWRAYTISDENAAQREHERKERMDKKSKKRVEKTERARASWGKRTKGQRLHTSKVLGFNPRARGHRSQRNSEHIDLSTLDNHAIPHSSDQENDPSSSHSDSSRSKNQSKRSKKRSPINEQWVKSAGLRYLGRFSASEQHFRTILMNKIKQAEQRESEDPAIHKQWIDATVLLAIEYEFINDEKLASDLAKAYKRKGLAQHAARQKMRQKKISNPHIEAALTDRYSFKEGDRVDPTLFAAVCAAKKKRIGPWGPTQVDYPTLQKQLAKLARRGFSYGIAKKVLQASLEEAEAWLYEGDK